MLARDLRGSSALCHSLQKREAFGSRLPEGQDGRGAAPDTGCLWHAQAAGRISGLCVSEQVQCFHALREDAGPEEPCQPGFASLRWRPLCSTPELPAGGSKGPPMSASPGPGVIRPPGLFGGYQLYERGGDREAGGRQLGVSPALSARSWLEEFISLPLSIYPVNIVQMHPCMYVCHTHRPILVRPYSECQSCNCVSSPW